MGNSGSISHFHATVKTKEGTTFRLTYSDLIDHVLLLREVIANPSLTKEGPVLDYFIKDYCERVAQGGMSSQQQQLKLPWEVEWIWHVHRLHPVAYMNDCAKQLPHGTLVDKMVYNVIKKRRRMRRTKLILVNKTSSDSRRTFKPSVDLVQAVMRQREFLEKFQKHRLFEFAFTRKDRPAFEQLVENYVSFIKLAQKEEMIVPTFDIDLIWHSHMRRPSHYQKISFALCGFIVDHDDAIEKNQLSD